MTGEWQNQHRIPKLHKPEASMALRTRRTPKRRSQGHKMNKVGALEVWACPHLTLAAAVTAALAARFRPLLPTLIMVS